MFGLDTKSIIAGLLIGWLIVPRIQSAIVSRGK